MSDDADPEDIASAGRLLAQLIIGCAEEVADQIIDRMLQLDGGKIPRSREEIWRLFQEAMHSIPDRSILTNTAFRNDKPRLAAGGFQNLNKEQQLMHA